jgi:hypothetical protein
MRCWCSNYVFGRLVDCVYLLLQYFVCVYAMKLNSDQQGHILPNRSKPAQTVDNGVTVCMPLMPELLNVIHVYLVPGGMTYGLHLAVMILIQLKKLAGLVMKVSQPYL